MAIKILHTADLHLDSPLQTLALRNVELQTRVRTASRKALERMVTYCIEEGVAALLISGDLYDRAERSVKTAVFLTIQMERLNEKGILVFYIKGNHDAENPITGEIPLPGNVHVFGGRGGKKQVPETDIWIHGVSFRDRQAPESLVPKLQSPEPTAINIAMLHTSLTGASGHDDYAPCALADLTSAGFDYWALGHIHKRQVYSQAPWVVMPGIPQGRHIGEAGPKSATLLNIENGAIHIKEVRTSTIEFRGSNCDVNNIVDERDLRQAMTRLLDEEMGATTSDYAILRVSLSGTTPLAWQIRRDRDYWQSLFEASAAETGRVWIEKLDLDLVTPTADGGVTGPVGELQDMMTRIATEEGFLTAARLEIEQMMSLLPHDRRAALVPSEEAQNEVLRRIADDAILTMTSQMRGAAREEET